MRDKAYSTATLCWCVGKRSSEMETTKFEEKDGFGGRLFGEMDSCCRDTPRLCLVGKGGRIRAGDA
jgi:hypothetical protein